MSSKPHYLGPEYSNRFKDSSLVEAYRLRSPYPAGVFEILTGLITDGPRAVLDAGCGTGNIARSLVHLVERVDAVDFSLPMIEKGRSLPGGDHPNLNWIHGRAEDAPLNPPYALVTAGQALHWMDWDIVLPRFRELLTPKGYLAIVDTRELPLPWAGELGEIIKRFSTNPDYQPVNLIEELEKRHLFHQLEEKKTAPVSFVQSIDDYVESFHSMSSLSRHHMTAHTASAFDDEIRALLSKFGAYCRKVEMQVVGTVLWGVPESA